jgi:hypothetical protein
MAVQSSQLQRLVSSGYGAPGRTPHDGLGLRRERRAFAALLKRTAVPRPVAGAIVGTLCLTGNLVTTWTRSRSVSRWDLVRCWLSLPDACT